MDSTVTFDQTLMRGSAYAVKHKHAQSFGASPQREEFPIDRGFLGLLIFLGTEVMFFAGLMSAFLILRAGSVAWPPPNQPRLPLFITGLNTLVLLASAFTMQRALQALRGSTTKSLAAWLATTLALGLLFLAVQGFEWVRLVQFGLTFNSSIYGGTFYTLIGAHAVHVLAAVIALALVVTRARRGYYSSENSRSLVLCRLYWFFVVGIWPVLYVLVYLN